jgi:hypothetical protein
MKIISQLALLSIPSNLLHYFDIRLNDLIRKTLNFSKERPIVFINFPFNKSGLGIPAVRDLHVMCSLMTHITVKSRNYMLQNFEKEFQKQFEPELSPPSDNLEIDLSAYSSDLKLPLTFTDTECKHFSGTFCLISRYLKDHKEPDFNSSSKCGLYMFWETLHNSRYTVLLKRMDPVLLDKWKMNKISSKLISDCDILKIIPRCAFEHLSNHEMEEFFSLYLPPLTNEFHSSILKLPTSDESHLMEILGNMSNHITFQLASFVRTVPGCQVSIQESGEENLILKIILANSIQTNEEKLLNLTRDSNHEIHLILQVKVTKSLVADSVDESDSISDTATTSAFQMIRFRTSMTGKLDDKANSFLRMLFLMSQVENRNQFMCTFRKHYLLILQSGNLFVHRTIVKSKRPVLQAIQEISFWREVYQSSFFLPYLTQIITNHHDGLFNLEKYLDEIPDRLRPTLESYSLFLDYNGQLPTWMLNSSTEIVGKTPAEQIKVASSKESTLLPSTPSSEHTLIKTPSLSASTSIQTSLLSRTIQSILPSYLTPKHRVPFPRTRLLTNETLRVFRDNLPAKSPTQSHPTLPQVLGLSAVELFSSAKCSLLQKIHPTKKHPKSSSEKTPPHQDLSSDSDSTHSDNPDDRSAHDEYCSRHMRKRKRLDISFDISGPLLTTTSATPTKSPVKTNVIRPPSPIVSSTVQDGSTIHPIVVLDELITVSPENVEDPGKERGEEKSS